MFGFLEHELRSEPEDDWCERMAKHPSAWRHSSSERACA
jgi:hypothetical protein